MSHEIDVAHSFIFFKAVFVLLLNASGFPSSFSALWCSHIITTLSNPAGFLSVPGHLLKPRRH